MAARTQPTKFDLRREATRAELIRLGRERFPIRGYAATTIDDVVRGTALSRGAYYFHFTSKGDLFLACLEAREEERAAWPELALDPAIAGLDEAYARVLGAFRAADGEHHLAWPLLQTEFWQSAKHDPELAERFRSLYERRMLALTTALEHLRDRGLVDLAGPLRPVAEVVYALGQGMDVHRELYDADESRFLETVVRALNG